MSEGDKAKNEKVLALVAGAVVIVAIGWTYLLRPTVERWNEARERVSRLQDQLDQAETLVARRNALEAEKSAIERALTPPDNGSGAASVAFYERLRILTEASGFKPVSLRHLRTDAFDAYAELRFELKVRAPLRQLEDFLVRMAASEWYLRAHAISLAPRDDGQVEADLSLVGLATQDALDPEDRPGSKGGKPK